MSGNLDGETQARPGHRLDVNRAADLIDVVADDVHADAAARYIGDLGRSGEPGSEYELVDLRFGELLDVGFRNEALRHRLRLDALGIEPAPIVGDPDDDETAFVIGGKPDQTVLGLACGAPLFRRFKAMVRRVTHHVRERILDEIEHLAIEFGLGAMHFELDLLPKFIGKVAHNARQFLPRIADRLHARLHHAFLQFGRHIGQPLQRRLEFGLFVATHDLEQLIAGQDELGHHCHQVFKRIDGHADRLTGALAVIVLCADIESRRGSGFEELRIGFGVTKRTFEIVKRVFIRLQRAFQDLRNKSADSMRGLCRVAR